MQACAVVRSAKSARIGFLAQGGVPAGRLEVFRTSLRELGWIEGQNLTIEQRYSDGRDERLPELARDLVHLPVDIIVGPGGANIDAAVQATSTIPIVVTTDADPVAEGRAVSLGKTWRERYGTDNRGAKTDGEAPGVSAQDRTWTPPARSSAEL